MWCTISSLIVEKGSRKIAHNWCVTQKIKLIVRNDNKIRQPWKPKINLDIWTFKNIGRGNFQNFHKTETVKINPKKILLIFRYYCQISKTFLINELFGLESFTEQESIRYYTVTKTYKFEYNPIKNFTHLLYLNLNKVFNII
jgi:hypothetical protein